MKQKFPLHLDGDLGCGHDIGMTSWKLHLDGGKQIFSTQAWLRHEFSRFPVVVALHTFPVVSYLGGIWKRGRIIIIRYHRNNVRYIVSGKEMQLNTALFYSRIPVVP